MNYQPLFDYMSKQHGVDLLETDMIEIVRIVNEMQKPEDPQPKTIREWFEELPEPYRSEALSICHSPNLEVLYLSIAVMKGIDWYCESNRFPERYWSNLYYKLCDQNK